MPPLLRAHPHALNLHPDLRHPDVRHPGLPHTDAPHPDAPSPQDSARGVVR